MEKWECSRTTVYYALTGRTQSGLARCIREDYDKMQKIVS